MNDVQSTSQTTIYGSTANTGDMIEVRTTQRQAGDASKKIENAVYAHIRAVRALGRTRINTSEIAAALRLNPGRVNEAIQALEARGVKIAK